jgi:DNA polymerase-4
MHARRAGPASSGDAPLDVLHLDMDCFFAAVEALDDSRLAGVPLVVGGTGDRGVVCSASYEARSYGVRSAMPTAEARRLCPAAVYVTPRHGRYAEVSEVIHTILRDVTPLVEPLGLDEAYLDVGGSHRLFGPSEAIALALRRRIRDELGLSCSVGVGRTKLIAKLASKAAKPGSPAARFAGARILEPAGPRSGQPDDLVPAHGEQLAAPADRRAGSGRLRVTGGVVVVGTADELAFLHRHPVRALPGVGPHTEQQLRRFGVSSVGDLAAVPVESLERLLGTAHGSALHALANGRDRRPLDAGRPVRSIGHEETFPHDLRDEAELARRARSMAAEVAKRCRSAGLVARTVSVKLRYADFTTQTRAQTLPAASSDPRVLADASVGLLAAARPWAGVRLLGVQVSSLGTPDSGSEQLELFARQLGTGEPGTREPDERGTVDGSLVEAVADSVRSRFGAAAITRAGALSRHAGVRDDGGPPGAVPARSERR